VLALARQLALAAATLPLALGVVGCTRSDESVDVARAQAHVDTLARAIGVRPIGSPANRDARTYIAGELERAGFTVRVQDTDAVDAPRGLTAHVVNIIATKDGSIRDGVALVSHYDSVPDGPGASDDALGVATCLESARMLAVAGLRHSIFVLVTDGEEAGLMGARAVVTDPEVAARVRTFLNFDGTGAAGATQLFETGPGWSAPLTAWARGAVAPAGQSFGIEVYRRLPNDTDFTVLKTIGAAGVNFAPIDDSYAYHTDRDIATRVDPFTLKHEIGNTVSTVRALDELDWTTTAPSATYFDVFRWRAVLYGAGTDRAIVWAALALSALAWIVLTRSVWRTRRMSGLVVTVGWALLRSLASVGAAIGAASLLRAFRMELNPWYAAPSWFFSLVIAAALLVAWLVERLAAWVRPSLAPVRQPDAVWWATLPVWAIATAVLHWQAPAAAYLFALPLGIAAVVVLFSTRSRALLATLSSLVLVISIALWAHNTSLLLHFMVPLFGWLPVVVPAWLYPAAIAVAALMIAPPAVAMLAGRTGRVVRSRRTGLALAVLFVATAVLAWTSPTYTSLRPERRTALYVQDDIMKRAWWQVGGPEAKLAVGEPGPPHAAWQSVTDAIPATLRVGPLDTAFAFRTPVVPLQAGAPADVSAVTSRRPDGGTRLDITVAPRALLTFRLLLPAGLQPSTSTLAGAVVDGTWHATYVAPPMSGLTIRMTFDGQDRVDLNGGAIMFTTAGVPGSPGESWPAWLSREHTAWRARTVLIEPLVAGG
jgi:hypothetical protein